MAIRLMKKISPQFLLVDRFLVWLYSLYDSLSLPPNLHEMSLFTVKYPFANSSFSLKIYHLLCVCPLALVVYSLSSLSEGETKTMSLMRIAMITMSILSYILYFYNKKMVVILDFEAIFDQYIMQSDIKSFEKHKIFQMREIDPERRYKLIEEYYNSQYPSLKFHLISSNEILTYPQQSHHKIFYILTLFLSDLLGISHKNRFTTSKQKVKSLIVLVYYKWIQSDAFEFLLLCMDPMAVIAGYYTNSLKVFGLMSVLGFMMVRGMVKSREGATEARSLGREEKKAEEYGAKEKLCEIV
eukprot:TRINITY_DN4463_c0_g1_i10.p1 TRINITY_DN4463_c0_g1~~TRINITY_DN4463_c0_g1_i10.p1  ORF type:complete len:298 (+),score=62.65 TRINITY_DN4463_c0_g1_i10:129-1022(+)